MAHSDMKIDKAIVVGEHKATLRVEASNPIHMLDYGNWELVNGRLMVSNYAYDRILKPFIANGNLRDAIVRRLPRREIKATEFEPQLNAAADAVDETGEHKQKAVRAVRKFLDSDVFRLMLKVDLEAAPMLKRLKAVREIGWLVRSMRDELAKLEPLLAEANLPISTDEIPPFKQWVMKMADL